MSGLLNALNSAFILGWRAGYGKNERKRDNLRILHPRWSQRTMFRLRWGWLIFKCPILLWWANGRRFDVRRGA
jgi:hypothetical protein